MAKKELLTEERYEAANKKLRKIALGIFIVGAVIGISLIIVGIVKINSQKKSSDVAAEISELKNKNDDIAKEIEGIESDIASEYDAKISDLESQKNTLEQQKTQIFMSRTNGGFSDAYYAKDNEIKAKAKEISTTIADKEKAIAGAIKDKNTELAANVNAMNSLESEKWKIENGWYLSQAIPFFIFGGMAIFAGAIYAAITWLITKRRAIAAYTMQSARPLIEEGTEKLTPTMSKAAGSISESVAKGIAKGIKEGKK